ncbi:MAG: radical SAM family heme chaperone HemW [Cellulosilyticaceae bacterium]
MRIGLYVHIPFCKMKCHYCDFLSFPKHHDYDSYVDALCEELAAYGKRALGVHTISSIFIGGGTPTVLPPFLLEKIGQTINTSFNLEEDLEWTIEANPGTIVEEHAKVFARIGINRVSLGLQAMQPCLLKKLGRIHSLEAWDESITILRKHGIKRINTDLMFSLPGQTLEDWQQTLAYVVGHDISHLSAYALIIEEGTPFYDAYERGELILPDEEVDRQMYHYAQQYLGEHGYVQYEISNWAKEGEACRHNILYWQQGSYIGAGLGAHGYLDGKRYHNTTNMFSYIEAKGCYENLVVEEEVITEQMAMEEYMFLGLRMKEGISVVGFKQKFGQDLIAIYGDVLEKWIKADALIQANDRVYLSDFGLDIANQVYASFLL